MMRKGETAVSTPYKVPSRWAPGSGGRTRLPDPSPRDGQGRDRELSDPHTVDLDGLPEGSLRKPGPYEEAVHSTPLLENFEKPEDYKGIDILRTIRSFDPCMPCTTHIHTENRVISRDVVTCACGVDDEHEH